MCGSSGVERYSRKEAKSEREQFPFFFHFCQIKYPPLYFLSIPSVSVFSFFLTYFFIVFFLSSLVPLTAEWLPIIFTCLSPTRKPNSPPTQIIYSTLSLPSFPCFFLSSLLSTSSFFSSPHINVNSLLILAKRDRAARLMPWYCMSNIPRPCVIDRNFSK